MDNLNSLDITDPIFSLDVPDVNEVIGFSDIDSTASNQYTFMIYIGVAILFVSIVILFYKHLYRSKGVLAKAHDVEQGFEYEEESSTYKKTI